MTEFELLRNESGENQLLLKIFTGQVHYMVKLDENELADLRDRLDQPPTPFER